MAPRFEHGEYVWTERFGETELVMIEENHGPARKGGRVDKITARYLNSEDTFETLSTALDREHPKARAAAMVRHAAGR